MNKQVLCITLNNDFDLVIAYRRAMQLGNMAGLSFTEQSKFATAVTEVCRNAIEHANEGKITFTFFDAPILSMEAKVEDSGKGIANIKEALEGYNPRGKKGLGLKNAQRLVDVFKIESEVDRGTIVRLQKRLPNLHPPINGTIVEGWREHLKNEKPESPYESLKKQNEQLLETLDQLRLKNLLIENQLHEINGLNHQLEKTNVEINNLLKEREEKNCQLEEQYKSMEEFAHIISHDLKAPINNLVGLLRHLKKRVKPGDGNVFDMMEGQLQKMSNMIKDLLTYAIGGKQKVETSIVDTEKLIQDVINTFDIPSGFVIKVQGELPVIRTEEVLLQQVFYNLIGNALKYHDRGQGTIAVEGKRIDKGFYQFVVADDGPGIPLEEREVIFDIFHTIRKARTLHSTGIGLSIVKKLILNKGGLIKVEDNVPRGAKFIFSWPGTELKENKTA
jgi:signal transduction histidine kinase